MSRKKALVTGASSGIGEEYARKLAMEGYDIILVGRNEANLSANTNELIESYNINAEYYCVDLNNLEEVDNFIQIIKDDTTIDFFVGCAGFAIPGYFLESEISKELSMINVHITANMKLIYAILPNMCKRKMGNIIIVSSTLAFINFPGNAIYCASKAYLNIFLKVLKQEINDTGINLQALNPGSTRTNFHNTDEYAKASTKRIIASDKLNMSVSEVVEYSYKKIGKELIVIPGLKNRLMVLFKSIVGFIISSIMHRKINSI